MSHAEGLLARRSPTRSFRRRGAWGPAFLGSFPMPTKVLAIDLIQVLGSVQPRQTLNEDAIADYSQIYTVADGQCPLPPVRGFKDGERFILSRGFHRVTA